MQNRQRNNHTCHNYPYAALVAVFFFILFFSNLQIIFKRYFAISEILATFATFKNRNDTETVGLWNAGFFLCLHISIREP